eukprot:scaffold14069_cov126-Isochrysis_galbana.AAC.4
MTHEPHSPNSPSRFSLLALLVLSSSPVARRAYLSALTAGLSHVGTSMRLALPRKCTFDYIKGICVHLLVFMPKGPPHPESRLRINLRGAGDSKEDTERN